MIKFVGALLIFLSSTAMGFAASSMYRTRCAQLESVYQLIVYISGQICAFLTPLERIYSAFKNKQLEQCGFLAQLRSVGGVRAIDECGARLLLSVQEKNELKSFFAELGQHEPKEEERYCAYYIERFKEFCGTANEKMPQKAKLCRTFGMLGGIMIAVILL